MICTVVQGKSLDEIQEILEHCEMAEIRLDRCPLSDSDIRICFSSDVPLVATCRVSEVLASDPSLNSVSASMVCEKKLVAAIEAGARYVDVELEASRSMAKRVRKSAMENGTVFIRSYHNFEATDSQAALSAVADKCQREGAQIVKIVTMASCAADVNRVMSLYDDADPGTLIAFCMGEAGRESRTGCLMKGAPYTYASLSEGDEAASGQIPAGQMAKEIYGDFRFIGNAPSESANGTALTESAPLVMPASKSFAQRAIIAAALADGESTLSGYSPCGDSASAIETARELGAEVSEDGDTLRIKGIAASPESLDLSCIHVGESGLLARIMIPVSTMLSKGAVVLEGEKSLLSRPMTGLCSIMDRFSVVLAGASAPGGDGSDTVDGTSGVVPAASGSDDDTVTVPVTASGPLKPARAEISGKHGSQIISGLLMSLPLLEKSSFVTVHDPKSIPYMYMTLDVLKKFGLKVSSEMMGGRDFIESGGDWSYCTDIEFRIKGGQRYRSADFRIEGDWSTAAVFLVAGAVFGRVELSGLDTTSIQADLSIMDILIEAGASLSQLDGDRGIVAVQRAPLNAFTTDLSNCPDLFPAVAVLAAFCQGRSYIHGTDRLAHKECDRASAITAMLEQMGVDARIEGNALSVDGHSLAQRLLTGSLLKGGRYSSFHDHRMAMALAVAGLGASPVIEIDDKECVAKSCPGFFEVFGSLVK